MSSCAKIPIIVCVRAPRDLSESMDALAKSPLCHVGEQLMTPDCFVSSVAVLPGAEFDASRINIMSDWDVGLVENPSDGNNIIRTILFPFHKCVFLRPESSRDESKAIRGEDKMSPCATEGCAKDMPNNVAAQENYSIDAEKLKGLARRLKKKRRFSAPVKQDYRKSSLCHVEKLGYYKWQSKILEISHENLCCRLGDVQSENEQLKKLIEVQENEGGSI